jgi:hypothetical protein
MTILIAHRGNVREVNHARENQFDYLIEAIELGFDVEVDVWKTTSSWCFGHDDANISVTLGQIQKIAPHSWFHAKNKGALIELGAMGYNTFMHADEPFAITSKGYKWSHKGMVNPYGIVVMPDLDTEQYLIKNCAGVCHDKLFQIQELLAT